MIERTKTHGRPEGCICEQCAYLPDPAVYQNSSGTNELGDRTKMTIEELKSDQF